MRHSRTSRRRHAFTLTELTVVVLIMGILVAVAAPKFSQSVSRYQAKAAAKRIAADLNYARLAAMNRGVVQTISFDIMANRYSMPNVVHPNSPALGYTVDLSSTAYPATIVSANFGGSAQFTFDIYGQPNVAGSITVDSGGFQQVIQLNAVTGLAAVP